MKIKKSHDNIFTLTSEIKYEQIEFLQSANPEALSVKDKDGNEVFAVGVCTKGGGISTSQIVFNDKSTEGCARVSFAVNVPAEEQKNAVASTIAGIKDYLDKLEESVPKAYDEAKKKYEGILSSITED